jgi:hypothetical protein
MLRQRSNSQFSNLVSDVVIERAGSTSIVRRPESTVCAVISARNSDSVYPYAFGSLYIDVADQCAQRDRWAHSN